MAEGSTAPRKVERLAAELSRPRAMRRASVSEGWMKSATGTWCACCDDDEARHGP